MSPIMHLAPCFVTRCGGRRDRLGGSLLYALCTLIYHFLKGWILFDHSTPTERMS